MRYIVFALIIVFAWGDVIPVRAEIVSKMDCTHEEAIKAELEASTLKDWDAVYLSYKRFYYCDDGAIWEGYSDAVGRLLSKHWDQINRLFVLVSLDNKFEDFVIRHIDETIPADKLQQIVKNTQYYCPPKSNRLCERIKLATH